MWSGTAAGLAAAAPASAYALATSDNERALAIAAGAPGVRAARSPGGALAITLAEGALDPLVLALGDARVVIRRLELLVSPLESMFFALSGDRRADALAPDDLAERILAGADA